MSPEEAVRNYQVARERTANAYTAWTAAEAAAAAARQEFNEAQAAQRQAHDELIAATAPGEEVA